MGRKQVRILTEKLVDWLNEWGVFGVLASLFVEGTAFPIVGTLLIVTFGFVMELDWHEMLWISLLGSFLYAVGSYIPYYLGYKLGDVLIRKLSPARRERLARASAAFSKYGIWSVAISSPLHLGNVVPFLAGLSKMRLGLYTALTMLGIAPSTFLLLSIGRLYPGDREQALRVIEAYQLWILAGLVAATAAWIGWRRYRQRRAKETSMNGGGSGGAPLSRR